MKKSIKKFLSMTLVLAMLGAMGTTSVLAAYDPTCNHSIEQAHRKYHSDCGKVDTYYSCKLCGWWWGCETV